LVYIPVEDQRRHVITDDGLGPLPIGTINRQCFVVRPKLCWPAMPR